MANQVYEELLEVDLFVDPPDDELVCPICLCVLKDAQQLNICGHLFCRHCITTHFQTMPATNFCPVDKRGASLANMVAAPRSIVNIISRLQLKCFNHREGCREVLTVENLLGRHAQVCTKRPCGPRSRIPRPDPSGAPTNSGIPINVFVKLASPAKTIVVTINTEATVRILKLRIHDKEGIDPNNMVLNFKGKPLNNENEVLSQYSVKSNDVFYITRRFEGGVKASN